MTDQEDMPEIPLIINISEQTYLFLGDYRAFLPDSYFNTAGKTGNDARY